MVKQCIDGDASAYRELYNRYSAAMFGTALRMLNNRADAEDILQDSFTDAFGQLEKFRQQSTFGAWLKRIVIYKSINFLKQRRNFIDDMNMLADTADEVYENHAIELTVEKIKAAIGEMPTGYRTVLSLHLFEGYSHEQIADLLGVAHSTARTQYIRGKQKLVTLLKAKAVHEQ